MVTITASSGSAVFGPFDLDRHSVLATRKDGSLYQHPTVAELLLKVVDHTGIKPGRLPTLLANLSAGLGRFAAQPQFLCALNEYVTAVALPGQVRDLPLAKILGVAHTSLGLGLLVEKILDGEGRLAPTLREVVARSGLGPTFRRNLRTLFETLAASHVVVDRVCADDIVFGIDSNGHKGMFLISGFGISRQTAPCKISRRLNARRVMRAYRGVLKELCAMSSGLPSADSNCRRRLIASVSQSDTSPFMPLDMAAINPLGRGNERVVYPYPHDEHMVLKVVKRNQRRFHWYKRWRRNDSCKTTLLELGSAVAQVTNDQLPMARVYGLVPTSMGMGLLVERISGIENQLAETLVDVVTREGFGAKLRDELAHTFEALTEAHIVIWDASPENFAWGRNREGKEAIYLVDGYGDRQWARVYELSKRLNARNNKEKYVKLVRWLERIDEQATLLRAA